MMRGDAEGRAAMHVASSGERGRNPRESGRGASKVTATRSRSGSGSLRLMEAVVERENMMLAYKRVVANKGSAGVDGMRVEDLKSYLISNWPRIREELLEGRYQPQPVLRVEIPKPAGGMRQLGIPTVLDRLIQQAMNQVLQPIFDPGFSESSFGFRPGRNAHQAVRKAHSYVASGRTFVVDMDIEKFFDRVNHDILMSRVARQVEDKRALGLIRRYLQAGMMEDGIVSARTEGTPQGGPLSPLLSNILLDELDKELERRGHSFCRYADDCNIYVRTRRSGERVLRSITRFLDKKLRLKVNASKSAVGRPWERKFLGYSMTRQRVVRLTIAPGSIQRFREKLRMLFRQGRGCSLETLLKRLTPLLRGWVNYFRLADTKTTFAALDSWIRRRLRWVIWRQWKRPRTRVRNLIRRGLTQPDARRAAYSGRGPWHCSRLWQMNVAYPNRFFAALGLVALQTYWQSLRNAS